MCFQLTKLFSSVFLGLLLCAVENLAYADIEQDRAEGIAWLLQNQNGDGSWGEGGAKIAATAEALEALRHSGSDYGFIYSRSLSWLANTKTDSVDSLSRKIIALEHAGFDTQEMGLTDELLARRNAFNIWGAFDGYSGGFPDTALAMEAINISGATYAYLGYFLDAVRTAQQNGDYGWSYVGHEVGATLPQKIMPTAFNLISLRHYAGWSIPLDSGTVYINSIMTRGVNWLLTKQVNGCFLDDPNVTTGDVHQTALAYIAIEAVRMAGVEPAGSVTALTDAQTFILGQQSINGSWHDDPYQSALALRTFPPAALPDSDGDGIPDAAEWQIDPINGDIDARNVIPGNGLSNNLTAQGFIAEVLEQHALPNVSVVPSGTPPYTWSLASGALPPGVTSINSAGVFIGVPTTAGIYPFTLSVQDAAFAKAVIPGFVKVIAAADSVTDTDNDGIPDSYELNNTFLKPLKPSDASQDQDNDGLTNLQEYLAGTDPANADTDRDGLTDKYELDNGLDPTKSDTDGDGLPDKYELDYSFLNPLDPSDASQDQDNDGLTNLQEYLAGTDPANADTDRDGLTDKYELDNGLDPTKKDTDRDGLDDGWEIDNSLDPLDGFCPSYICGVGSWRYTL